MTLIVALDPNLVKYLMTLCSAQLEIAGFAQLEISPF